MNFHGSSIYSNLRIANNSDILQFENVLYTNCAICHIIEYYSAVKREGLLIPIWMNLKNIMLSQARPKRLHTASFRPFEFPEQAGLIGEVTWLPRDGAGFCGEGSERTFRGHGVAP